MFEQSAVVPWLVRVPGESPRRFSDPVSHIDFVPTMLHLLGKSRHCQCVGRSKANVIRGDAEVSDFIFLEWAPTRSDIDFSSSTLASKKQIRNCLRESTRAIVSPDGWKLCLRDKDKNELYNFRDDLDERHNLFYDNSHRDIVAELTTQIHRWQQRIGDTIEV
jgi:arylsulfatase A-like enzyme